MRILVHSFGLKRSGNHAIINWLLKNVSVGYNEPGENDTYYYNDVYAPHTDPPRFLQPSDLAIQSGSKDLLMILGYEDVPLEKIKSLPTVVYQDAILEDSIKYNLLLLRDPFNFFASRLQRLRNLEQENVHLSIGKIPLDEVKEQWKTYAKEFIGDTNILEKKIVISYNQWFTDKGYRGALLRDHFGCQKNPDLGMDEVLPYGRGSSFDQLSYHGRAREMGVLDRWRHFVNDDFYRELFQDSEIVNLSERIFGHIRGTETLYNSFSNRERVVRIL